MKIYLISLFICFLVCLGIFAKLMGDHERSKESVKTSERTLEKNSLLEIHGPKIFYSCGMKYIVYLPHDPRRTTLIVNLTKDSLECEYYRNHIKP